MFDQNRRGPVVTEVLLTEEGRSKAGCGSRSVTLIGQRLWRNTAVTIGSVRASEISVLPDMSAVVATFGKNLSEGITGKLMVWTSEGFANAPTQRAVSIPPVDGPCTSY